MIITKACRLYPTKLQESYFWCALRTYNYLFNKAKEWCEAYYKEHKEIMPKKELMDLVKGYKPVFQETCDFIIEHHTYRDGAEAYYDALVKALKGKRGLPKWKHGRYQRVRSFMVRTDGYRRYSMLNNSYITVPGLTRVDPKCKYVRSNINRTKWNYGNRGIRSARVVWDGKYWFLQYTIEVEPDVVEIFADPIGLDQGIAHYLVTDKGVKYNSIWEMNKYKKLVRRVKGYQKQLARQRKNKNYQESKNYWKVRKRLLMVERNLAEFKKSFVISVAKSVLADKPAAVVMETLNIKGMKTSASKKLRSKIHEVGWYILKQRISHETIKYGGTFIEAPRTYPSTKMCNNCKEKQDMPLSVRTYHCSVCGYVEDRDVNAAKNLRLLAFE